MTTWREVKTLLVQPPSARRQHVRADEYARLCSIIIIIITIVVIFHITVAVISDISRLRKNDKPSFGRCYPWLHPLSSCMSSVTSDMLIVFTYLLTYLLADRAHRLCDRDGRSVDHVQSSAARRELSMLHALASRPVSTCINCNDVAARDLRSSSHTARMSTSSNTVVAPSAAGHFPPPNTSPSTYSLALPLLKCEKFVNPIPNVNLDPPPNLISLLFYVYAMVRSGMSHGNVQSHGNVPWSCPRKMSGSRLQNAVVESGRLCWQIYTSSSVFLLPDCMTTRRCFDRQIKLITSVSLYSVTLCRCYKTHMEFNGSNVIQSEYALIILPHNTSAHSIRHVLFGNFLYLANATFIHL